MPTFKLFVKYNVLRFKEIASSVSDFFELFPKYFVSAEDDK